MISLYIAERTWLHRIPAGWKLLALAAATILILPQDNPLVLAGALAPVALLYALLPSAWAAAWRLLRPLLLLMAILFALYLWSGQPEVGALVMLRILTLVLLANLITLTTRVDAMMAALLPLFAPFRLVGLPPRRLALGVALAIRFVPLLFETYGGLAEAWRARSPRRPLWRLVPAFSAQALGTAERVAEALSARGGAEGFANDAGQGAGQGRPEPKEASGRAP